MSLFQELKRRNVFRVGIAYVVLGWVLLQVVDVVVPILALPDWVARLVLLLLGLGFPVVLIFAWAFELTPEGLKREKDVDRSQSIAASTARKLDRTIIVILVLAVVLLVLDRNSEKEPDQSIASAGAPANHETPEQGSEPSTQPGNAEASVAVLPFVNMSDDAENEYFSDGISEELLNVLVRVQGLRVPSRTSSFSFKGSNRKISEIGKELQVDHVLEGSVRKSGDRIRVTAQLIDVRTDTHLWSETFTRELDDIFAVQDEIAQAIVAALKVKLNPDQQQALVHSGTQNVEAYNKYLLGRHFWNQRIPGRMTEAIAPLREAVGLDPDFDQAWSALADVYVLLPEYLEGTVADNIPLALEAAKKALAINPSSARALTTSAYIKAMYYYRWDEAESEFKQAIELEPGYATAHQWYAEMLSVQRRTDEALAQLDVAAAVDPLAPIISHVKGWVALWAGRLDEAEGYYLTALKLDPGLPFAISNLGQLYMARGDYERARARWSEYFRLLGQTPGPQLLVIDAMENPELRDQAIAALQSSGIPADPFNLPALYANLGRLDLSLETILANFEAGGVYSVQVNRMVIFDPLREDPRFRAMLTQMNLNP